MTTNIDTRDDDYQPRPYRITTFDDHTSKAAKVRALVNDIFGTAKDEVILDREKLNTMCLLGGAAVVHLMDYIKLLEEQDTVVPRG